MGLYCYTVPFGFRWSRWYIQNSSSYLIIKLEVSAFPTAVLFSVLVCLGCCTIICCRFHIYPGKAGFVSFITAVLWCAQIIKHIMVRWLYSFVCSSYIFLMMTVRRRVFYLIISIKSEVWLICHCLGLGHKTTVCTVCPYILISVCYLSNIVIEFNWNDLCEFVSFIFQPVRREWVLKRALSKWWNLLSRLWKRCIQLWLWRWIDRHKLWNRWVTKGGRCVLRVYLVFSV